MYGSILMDVTSMPQQFSNVPNELAITPLPTPLMTPPVTKIYFIVCVCVNWFCELILINWAASSNFHFPITDFHATFHLCLLLFFVFISICVLICCVISSCWTYLTRVFLQNGECAYGTKPQVNELLDEQLECLCVSVCVCVWVKPSDRCKEGTNSPKCWNTTDMRLGLCWSRV